MAAITDRPVSCRRSRGGPVTTADPMELLRNAVSPEGEPVLMMPPEAYTSAEVLAWERRHLFAGGWTCLGRESELLPHPAAGKAVSQRAAMVGDVSVLLV